ncbi:MAG TPA: hypothetical protein VNQ76_10950 [Planctomicrobium sp.]|nr:hypothetical protein [Planctomicrobium sp.]
MKIWTKYSFIRILAGICLLFGACGILTFPAWRPSAPISGKRVFTNATGFQTDSDWQVLNAGDDHGGFMGDGETFVILKVSQKAIDQFLESSPPWSKEWQTGPVPHDIGSHRRFGADGVISYSVNGLPNRYSGNTKLVELLSSSEIFYDAKERCCETLRWHNGDLLIISPQDQTVWLSLWDF